jgi:hypothetical protein
MANPRRELVTEQNETIVNRGTCDADATQDLPTPT